MARAQKKTNHNKQNNQTKKEHFEKTNVSQQTKRETTEGEILFLKIALSVIVFVVVALGVFFLVQYLMREKSEDENPFADFIHITQTDFVNLTKDNGDNTFGDFQYFANNDSEDYYADLHRLIMTQDIIYFYIYKSSDINDEVLELITNNEVFGEIAFFFLDLDQVGNSTLFDNQELSHLDLRSNATHQLLVFDDFSDTTPFTLNFRDTQIIRALNSIIDGE